MAENFRNSDQYTEPKQIPSEEKKTEKVTSRSDKKATHKELIGKEVSPHSNTLIPTKEKKPPLKLDLEAIDISDTPDEHSEISLFGNTNSGAAFNQLFEGTLREKQLNISSDVIFAEDEENSKIGVEDMIKQIDGAEVSLEYKF